LIYLIEEETVIRNSKYGKSIQEKLFNENKPIIERFLSKNNFKPSKGVKSIIKFNDYNYELLNGGPSYPNEAPVIENVYKEKVFDNTLDSEIYYNISFYLNNFYTKSTEEFIKRKYNKIKKKKKK